MNITGGAPSKQLPSRTMARQLEIALWVETGHVFPRYQIDELAVRSDQPTAQRLVSERQEKLQSKNGAPRLSRGDST